ncbi:amidohydrolase [Leifsonia sp. NPDC077715]|uniref:amidohydrolase n=1 Tax=Leifsonia sp. NPDC077715 TaxID=3155539 RepID=UPI00343DD93B
MPDLRDLSRPTEPSSSYLDALRERTAERAARAEPLTSPHEGAPPELSAEVAAAVQQRAGAVTALSRQIFATPEEAFEEHRSARAIASAIRAEGWDATVGVFGQPTAVLAQAGRGDGPSIALLAEYDALPGIGHGCGHNIIAASAVGAFLAVATVADHLDGRVVLLGTPAEEGNSGKELLAREGAFDGLDAAIMAHPFGYDAADHPFIGRRILRVHYTGVAAHASATPFMGRNALDAVNLHYQAVAQLRQHIPPGDRVHGIVLHGGDRPSIVPATSTLEYYLRSHEAATLRELSTRLEEISHGVALATGTGVRLEWDPQPFTLPTRFNRPLSERWAVHQEDVGRRVLTREVVPTELAASTDFGNVSVRIPGIHPVIAVAPPDVALHTAEFAEYASSEAGDRAAVDAAHGLALTALDFLTDAALRDATAADFAAAGGPIDVERYFS